MKTKTLWRVTPDPRGHKRKGVPGQGISLRWLINDSSGFVYCSPLTSKTQAVLSSEVETRYSRLADTSMDWIMSECPLNVITHSADRLSHNLTLPSRHPVATYDASSHAKHVTPACPHNNIPFIRHKMKICSSRPEYNYNKSSWSFEIHSLIHIISCFSKSIVTFYKHIFLFRFLINMRDSNGYAIWEGSRTQVWHLPKERFEQTSWSHVCRDNACSISQMVSFWSNPPTAAQRSLLYDFKSQYYWWLTSNLREQGLVIRSYKKHNAIIERMYIDDWNMHNTHKLSRLFYGIYLGANPTHSTGFECEASVSITC